MGIPQQKTDDRLVLSADTAADLMTPNPMSVRGGATVAEAVVLFTNKGISAAAVLDEAGRPLGVLSRTDVLVHDRQEHEKAGIPAEKTEPARVRDVMTPVVHHVTATAPVAEAARIMVERHIHRLVVTQGRQPVGMITSMDLLRVVAEQS